MFNVLEKPFLFISTSPIICLSLYLQRTIFKFELKGSKTVLVERQKDGNICSGLVEIKFVKKDKIPQTVATPQTRYWEILIKLLLY